MRHPISVQGNEFAAGGTNRREFIKIITMAAASVGLTYERRRQRSQRPRREA